MEQKETELPSVTPFTILTFEQLIFTSPCKFNYLDLLKCQYLCRTKGNLVHCYIMWPKYELFT